MLWRLEQTDELFLAAFEPAGEPDQAVIEAYLARQRAPQAQQKHVGFKRWYYFLQDNHRICLTTIGMPLDDWRGAAMILVGTREIIGEFAGNRHLVGKTGLRIQMQPIAWLQGNADEVYANGTALLTGISEQVLDRKEIERSQEARLRKYQHPRQN